MKTFSKTQGKVINNANKYYMLKVDGNPIIIPKTVMHRYVVFPGECLENDELKVSTLIDLTKIECDGKTTYYPDHSAYRLKEQITPQNLLIGLEEFSRDLDFESTLENLSKRISEIDSKDCLRILKLLEGNQKQEVKKELMALWGEFDGFPDEGESIEYKSSLYHVAQGSKFESQKNGQLMELTMSAAAIANTTGKGLIIVGVKDKSKGYVASGIENEIVEEYPHLTLDLFQNTVLTNFMKTYTGSDSFMQALKFKWMKYQGHLILRIDIDFKGDIVLCNSSNSPYIPYRVGSSTHCVHGYGLIDYIRNHSNNTNIANN